HAVVRRGHQVEEPSLAEPEGGPVELVVRDEARMLLAAGACELDLVDGRMRRSGQPHEPAERRERHVRRAEARAGKRVAAAENVVHGLYNVLSAERLPNRARSRSGG